VCLKVYQANLSEKGSDKCYCFNKLVGLAFPKFGHLGRPENNYMSNTSGFDEKLVTSNLMFS